MVFSCTFGAPSDDGLGSPPAAVPVPPQTCGSRWGFRACSPVIVAGWSVDQEQEPRGAGGISAWQSCVRLVGSWTLRQVAQALDVSPVAEPRLVSFAFISSKRSRSCSDPVSRSITCPGKILAARCVCPRGRAHAATMVEAC